MMSKIYCTVKWLFLLYLCCLRERIIFLTDLKQKNFLSALQMAQPSPHFSDSEINALPFNGQQAATAITALWLWRSTAFRWLQQPISPLTNRACVDSMHVGVVQIGA
jgi:GAF domain-containing protein